MTQHKKGNGKSVVLSVIGRDRPGIVASVSRVLYQSGCNIEALSQIAILGQFAMIVIASGASGETLEELRRGCENLMRDQGLDIHLKELRPEDMVAYRKGETEPFVITVWGEDRPGLAFGISETLADCGVNITNLDARVATIENKLEYIQIFEVDVPGDLDLEVVRGRLRERGEQMGVRVDLQHRGIFRAMNQI